VVALPVLSVGGRVLVALEHRDLPAVQRFTGSSSIVVAPAWRLPRTIKHLFDIDRFLAEAMRREFGLNVTGQWELGGAYFSSSGATPERVYPMAVEVQAGSAAASQLRLVDLQQAIDRIELIEDAHLQIALFRLAHALSITASD
jgi:hypothetical protein